MGVYYNPLWVTQAAVNDSTKKVIGTDIPISSIVTSGDFLMEIRIQQNSFTG